MKTLVEKVFSKIRVTDSCWIWTASLSSPGYGQVTHRGKNLIAHRVVYELLRGKIPEGLEIDHLCRNRNCVNPNHLEPVTLKENQLRGFSVGGKNARKTICPKGHPYTEKNTRHYKASRYCRECGRLRTLARRSSTRNLKALKSYV